VLYFCQIVVTDKLVKASCMVDLRHGVYLPYLRQWRFSQFLSQEELAKRAGIHANTVSAAERGRPVQLSKVGRLAKVLGIDRQTLVSTPPPEDVTC
jgi:DNA-binding XRE family transcriptional regulator